MVPCPLCAAENSSHYFRDTRDYYQCGRCALVFVPEHQLPAREAEVSQYRLHRNSPEDLGYRRFLSRVVAPVTEHCPPPAHGLDFGCGPNPALPTVFRELGYSMDQYDPFFFDDASVLSRRYDFLCATEVMEHVHRPAEVWPFLLSAVRPGGCIGVMTKRVLNKSAFATWHYKNDPTHVRFYSDSTLFFLARRYACELRLPAADVALFVLP